METKTMKPTLNDVAVLFLFFARPEQTQAVFEQIKLARPSKLFLYQDGPRPNRKDDIENIAKCRAIVEQIDWECEVYRKYQEQNFGCDPSEYISQKWMFSIVDKGIILEDDDVPSQSFFPFCKELLDRYEHDDRINMICGMNNIDTYTDSCPYSYFFSRTGSIWGWATWKRNVDLWDPNYKFLDNPYYVRLIEEQEGSQASSLFKRIKTHKNSGREHYESILGMHRRLWGQLNIVPTLNMITNIGIGINTTHSTSDIKLLPPASRRLLYKKRHEIQFPLKHPEYIVEDRGYEQQMYKAMHVSFLVKAFYKIKRICYKIKK